MNEIKTKKERRFLKTLGRVGEILLEQVLLKLGSSIIRKIGGKKTLPSILFLLLSLSLFAQFPNTLNKQRLGFQTTADGLVWRGTISDTASIQPINNQNAWVILDTINLKFYTFDFSSNVWNLVGGAAFAQPVDSLFFNVNVPTNNVDTAKMRWDSDLATVVLGLNDNVPNEIGFKNFWLVKNQTGSTITKGSLVYANGTVGASGRITVAKFIANGTIDAKYLLGITAHDLTDGEDGYVISFGKIRQVNTDTFASGAILYPSPTVAGVWTDVEPVAPNLDMPIGFCINSSSNNGTIAIRVASGYKLNELHDVSISSPVEKASLYYSGGLWRDTTAALLVSDTASMLANYATKEYADTTGRLYARQDFTNVSSSTLTWTQRDTLIPGGVNVVQVYRNGQILLPSQYTIPTSTSVVIAASSFKVNDNYTVIFPRGGGAGSGGGSGSLTSISGGTGIIVSPNPITTTGTVSADLSVLMELTDTSLLNLTSRFNTKQNTLVSGTNIKTVNSNSLLGSGNISVGTLVAADTVSLSNRINTKLNSTDTASLSNRINLKLNALDTASLSNRIDAKGTGTVTSVATGYGLSGGTITTTGTLLLDSAVVFSRIRDSIVDVAIGNDTIKILKQEYAPATTSVLTWTITSKFPIQSKSFILVFRNGQLLINDQYNLTDTNKITIVSNSFKVGANYTVVTVSGIGSVGTGVFPNPVYPEAGIAVSTGSAWASSVPNNSSNWNIAFNDKITNAAFSGTTTKTLTLTQYDGGTFAPTFTDLQGVTGVTAGTGLTGGTITTTGTVAVDFTTVAPLASPTFTGTVSGITKSMVGLGNVDNTSDANKPISTATQTALNLKVNISDTDSMLTPYFRDADTSQLNLTSRFNTKQNTLSGTGFVKASGTNITYDNSTYLTTGTAASTYLPFTGGVLTNSANNTLTVNSVATNTSDNISLIASASSPGYHNTNIGVRGVGQTIYNSGIGIQGEATQTDMNGFGSAYGVQGIVNGTGSGGNGSTYGGYFSNTTTVAGNNYGLYVSTASGGDYGIYQTGTGSNYFQGATTLGSTLAVQGDITEAGNNVLTSADTTSMLMPYLRKADTTNKWVNSVVALNDSMFTVSKGTTSTDITIKSVSNSVTAKKLTTSVYNNSGATIAKGSVVYINGAHSSNLPTIAKAIANSESTSAYTYGLVENDIADNSQGIVIQNGSITNLNLPTSTYTDGQALYLSPTVAGGYTLTKPLAPYHYVAIGTITRAHPTLGTIQVTIRNGFQLDELSDVSIALVPLDSTILQFSRVDSLWHDVNPTTAMGNRFVKSVDSATMLSPYYRTATATAALATKLNISDTSIFARKLIQTNRQTASYTLALTDLNQLVEINNASANTLTVPLNSSIAFAIGSKIDIVQYGAGQTTITPISGVTINSYLGALKIAGRYGACTLVKIGTNEWYCFGNLSN